MLNISTIKNRWVQAPSVADQPATILNEQPGPVVALLALTCMPRVHGTSANRKAQNCSKIRLLGKQQSLLVLHVREALTSTSNAHFAAHQKGSSHKMARSATQAAHASPTSRRLPTALL